MDKKSIIHTFYKKAKNSVASVESINDANYSSVLMYAKDSLKDKFSNNFSKWEETLFNSPLHKNCHLLNVIANFSASSITTPQLIVWDSIARDAGADDKVTPLRHQNGLYHGISLLIKDQHDFCYCISGCASDDVAKTIFHQRFLALKNRYMRQFWS